MQHRAPAWLLLAVTLLFSTQLTRAQSPIDYPHHAYVPLLARQAGEAVGGLPGETTVHDGIATYYNADGRGACSFDASPQNLMVGAMNAPEFDNSNICGAFVEIVGAKTTIVVRIVDLCPECLAGHIDLSAEAFARIDEPRKGRVPIKWRIVSPPVTGPIAFHYKDGSNAWWKGIQVRNHRNPIAKLELRQSSGNYVELKRESYNYFIRQSPGGEERGPFTFRVTDKYGHVIVATGIPFAENSTFNASDQFPPP